MDCGSNMEVVFSAVRLSTETENKAEGAQDGACSGAQKIADKQQQNLPL